jgi:hypothetical protein
VSDGNSALRIVRGDPSAEELAAVTALVAAAASGSDAPEPEAPRRGRWADPSWQHVRVPYPGPGAWASSCR